MNIYGFGIIKNGVKFDFPFKESIKSVQPILKNFVYNYGVSNDDTLKELEKIDNLEIITVDWDDSRTDGGYIFSDMTNIALNKIRENADPIEDKDALEIYIQNDEVIHEEDIEFIK